MNKIVIITGATGGIGSATAKQLAPKYQLILLGTSEKKLQSLSKILDAKVPVIKMAIDFKNPADCGHLFQRQDIDWSQLHGMVNCAGVSIGADVCHATLSDWEETLAINLTTPFYLIQQFAKKVKEKEGEQGGSIVNISSLAALIGSKKPQYAASKAGLIGLTKAVAAQLGGHNIRCNAICPGAVDTPMIADWNTAKKSHIADLTPLDRLANPAEIAAIIEFLLSDKSSFITGAVINATGGQYL